MAEQLFCYFKWGRQGKDGNMGLVLVVYYISQLEDLCVHLGMVSFFSCVASVWIMLEPSPYT